MADKKRKLEAGPDDEEHEKRISLRKYLAPMTLETVKELLVDIGAKNSSAFDDIVRTASSDVANRKLFVRGLSYTTTNDTLKAAFTTQFGPVEEVNVVMDRQTNRSRCYGFVTMESMQDAYRAVDETNVQVDGRQIFINLAAVRTFQGSGGGGGGGGGAVSGGQADGSDVSMRKLFVRGLSETHTEEVLRSLFSPFGTIEDMNIPKDTTTMSAKGYAFVTYATARAASNALVNPHQEILGRTLHWNLAAAGGKSKGGGSGQGGGGGGAGAMAPPAGGGAAGLGALAGVNPAALGAALAALAGSAPGAAGAYGADPAAAYGMAGGMAQGPAGAAAQAGLLGGGGAGMFGQQQYGQQNWQGYQ